MQPWWTITTSFKTLIVLWFWFENRANNNFIKFTCFVLNIKLSLHVRSFRNISHIALYVLLRHSEKYFLSTLPHGLANQKHWPGELLCKLKLVNIAVMNHHSTGTGQQPTDTTLGCRRLHFLFTTSVIFKLVFFWFSERFQQFQIRPRSSPEGQ